METPKTVKGKLARAYQLLKTAPAQLFPNVLNGQIKPFYIGVHDGIHINKDEVFALFRTREYAPNIPVCYVEEDSFWYKTGYKCGVDLALNTKYGIFVLTLASKLNIV